MDACARYDRNERALCEASTEDRGSVSRALRNGYHGPHRAGRRGKSREHRKRREDATRAGDTVAPATATEPNEEAAAPSAEYVVDRIAVHRTARGGVEYKSPWYGYTARDTRSSPPMASAAIHRPVLAYAPAGTGLTRVTTR